MKFIKVHCFNCEEKKIGEIAEEVLHMHTYVNDDVIEQRNKKCNVIVVEVPHIRTKWWRHTMWSTSVKNSDKSATFYHCLLK